MSKRFPPIDPAFPHMLHGGDYNPDQWLHHPGVIDLDFKMAAEAGVNTFTLGVFSWSQYEPRDGQYTFDWMDRIMDRMAKAGMRAVLATPSGSKPASTVSRAEDRLS